MRRSAATPQKLRFRPFSAATGQASAMVGQLKVVSVKYLGVLPGPFFPKTTGFEYESSPYLSELSEFRKDFTIISGLSHPDVAGGLRVGDGKGVDPHGSVAAELG